MYSTYFIAPEAYQYLEIIKFYVKMFDTTNQIQGGQ